MVPTIISMDKSINDFATEKRWKKNYLNILYCQYKFQFIKNGVVNFLPYKNTLLM